MSSEAFGELSEVGLHPDGWLAGIFGRPVWRVHRREGSLPFGVLASATAGFAYAKHDVSQVEIVSGLVDKGFRIVDTSLTFEGGRLHGLPSSHVLRHAKPKDEQGVRDIARSAFRFSRFHLDPKVPLNLANTIKAEWAGNFFSGQRGDGMVVAESGGRVVGFLQSIWSSKNVLIVDLIGVHPDCQGRGLGKALILHASRHGTGDGRVPSAIRVGTQAANTLSVRLYESLGLRLCSAQYVLHFHCSQRTTQP